LSVLEAGAAHSQWFQQFALKELAERLPGARGDELAEDKVAQIAAGRCRSGPEPEPPAPLQLTGQKRPGVGWRRACRPHPADRRRVRQPGGVRQQVAGRDQRHGSVPDAQFRNVLDDRCIQI
jgi:hypothetical protein